MSHTPESNPNCIFKCRRQLHHVAEKLATLYRQKELCDTTLIAGADNTEVKAHHLVLYLSSEYFQTMFHNGLEESKPEVVTIDKVDGDTLKKIVGFMYTFEIEMGKESIENVLSAATLLQIKTLVDGCCDLLADQLSTSNCLKFVDLAAQHNYTSLYEKSLSYAYKNFQEVSDGEEFLKLTEPELSKFLSQDGVNVISQEVLFLSLIKWLKHDRESRDESMYILLNDFIRFAHLEPKFILENAESVAHIAKCAKLLFSWLNWHSSKATEQIKQEKQEVETLKKKKIILAYFFEEKRLPVFRVDSYDPELNKWSVENWPQPLTMRKNYGIAITQNECYIAGGWIDNKYTKSVECLDLKTMKWRSLPPMLTERSSFGMSVLNGCLYVVGGSNWKGLVRVVEKYDFSDGKWTVLAELPEAHWSVRAVAIGGKLYVSGRENSHLECYDPATNEWSKTSDNNGKTSDFGLTANDEYVYAVGGKCNYRDTDIVERYNPADNTWTVMKSMTTQRSPSACLTVGYNLLVCGGIYASNRHIFEEYNEITKEWKHLEECPEKFKSTPLACAHLSIIYQ